MSVLYQLIFRQNSQIPLRCFQDVFRDIFVIQWHPESLDTMKISFTRPRVYLIDFEAAIQFPAECPETECVSMGPPLGGSSSTELEQYARPRAPEFASGITYSPFKLDVWQLGISFSDFKVKATKAPFYIFTLLFSCLKCLARFPEHHSRNRRGPGGYD